MGDLVATWLPPLVDALTGIEILVPEYGDSAESQLHGADWSGSVVICVDCSSVAGLPESWSIYAGACSLCRHTGSVGEVVVVYVYVAFRS